MEVLDRRGWVRHAAGRGCVEGVDGCDGGWDSLSGGGVVGCCVRGVLGVLTVFFLEDEVLVIISRRIYENALELGGGAGVDNVDLISVMLCYFFVLILIHNKALNNFADFISNFVKLIFDLFHVAI